MHNILVVEDEPINMKLMTKILSKNNLTVIPAVNGGDALRIISERNDIDVVLMDIQMPVMNGYEATEKIRELEKNSQKRVRIIALTANSYESDKEKCFRAGMDDFITKPIDMKSLIEKIKQENISN